MNQFMERVFNYCDDILEDRINACREHKWAVKRFLKDYEACQSGDSLFYFDEDVLEDFYWWAYEHKHVEGVLAGQPIELSDWQLFNAANIFGFKKQNGARRFRNAFIEVARKNAKSQFLGLIADYICFLGDEKQRAYIAGWTRDQSAEVYEAVRSGIDGSELLKGKWKEAYGKIEIFNNHSVIIPLSKEARKTGDGKNPSVGIVDEYHAHETSEIYDVLKSGMVARREPLMFIITTAGFDLSRPCFKEYEYVKRILDPNDDTENDDYYVMICQLDKDDDIKDESNWIKANPIVATYQEGIDSLRSDLTAALGAPEKMRSFLTKNMNIWVDMKEDGYLSLNKWDDCGIKEIPDLTNYPCFAGLDLSATTDLTSIGLVFKLDDGKYFVRQHSFMPEDKFKERMQTDQVRYDLWKEQGYLTLTPGAVVDYNFVESYLLDMREDGYQIQEVPYDKWNATHVANNLINEGFEAVEMPQSIRHLSEPTKNFRSEVLQKNILHENDPLLRWAMNNAIVKIDDQENIMISKSKSKNRIDPVAAIINGFARAMVAKPKRESVYKTRGAFSL